MTSLRYRLLAVGLPACIFAVAPAAFAQEPAAPPAASQAVVEDVEPEAVDALKRMSAYLTSLNTSEVTSRGSIDVVMASGQRVQLDGVTTYKIRKPGFVVDYVSDFKKRRFFYDGKQFTIYAPESGFYATAAAPPTNREALNELSERYGVVLPLEDLFRWADPNEIRVNALQAAYDEGTVTLDGVQTDHFSFREKDIDWEIWIQKGAQPLPRKVVIVDRTDPAHPTFIARLDWKVNPTYTDGDFAFAPDQNAKKIELATFQGSGE